jgi:hypothetical protein
MRPRCPFPGFILRLPDELTDTLVAVISTNGIHQNGRRRDHERNRQIVHAWPQPGRAAGYRTLQQAFGRSIKDHIDEMHFVFEGSSTKKVSKAVKREIRKKKKARRRS